MRFWKSIDPWSSFVIVLTAALFSLSLVVNGFTHDLFLEAGVFLVSVKLILMTGKHAASEERLEMHLKEVKEMLARQIATSSSEARTTRPGQRTLSEGSPEERKIL